MSIISISATLPSNSYHSNYILFLWILIQIHKLRKILINNSRDSNHSPKCTVLVIVAFTKEEKKKRRRQLKANTSPFSEYYCVHMRITLNF